MKVSQVCVIIKLRSKLLNPLGFELVTVLWTFYSEKLVVLFRSSGFLVLILKKIAEKNASSKPLVSRID